MAIFGCFKMLHSHLCTSGFLRGKFGSVGIIGTSRKEVAAAGHPQAKRRFL
jgi:hypothetical protein